VRITQTMVANDMIAALSQNYQTLDTIDNQLATGKSVRMPSDNPTAVSNAISVQASITANTAYQSSTSAAQNWLQSTSSALQQLASVVERARTLAVQGANDSNTGSDRTDIASEINQLMQQIVQIGNTTYAGSSIFAGTLVTTTPFSSIGGYSGNTGAITHQIALGYSMQVNVDPTTIFTGTGGIYHVLQRLSADLSANGNPTPPQNTGTEAMSLGGSYAGTNAYKIKVGAVTAGAISQIQYSLDGGATWTTVNGSGTGPNDTFNLGSGIMATFNNGATPAVGDTFSFNGAPGSSASTFAITNGGGNTGTETLSLSGNDTGVLSFLTKVTGVTNNVVSQVQYSIDSGQNWITATRSGSSPSYTFAFGATGVTASYANGSVFPTVGDQFAFSANPFAAISSYAIQQGPNTGNESATVTGSYTGSGSPQYVFKMAGMDANNNITSIQVSTDGGTTFQPAITATNDTGAALPFPTTTTFDLGNGLTLNLTQSTGSLPTVGASGDTLTYVTQGQQVSNDISTLDAFNNTLSGQMAQLGAETNATQNNLTQMQGQATQLQSNLSQLIDADMVALSTQMATAQNLFQAALQVDAKSIQPSLIDFLH
jgi:flagellar hook-associated protein 3